MILRNTERQHEKAKSLDVLDEREILGHLHDGQVAAVKSVAQALPQIGQATSLLVAALATGGNIFYAAAGSSGLMGLADGLELPGTFGIAPERIHILLAGGAASLTHLTGGVEDDTAMARADGSAIRAGDCVICISASGSTPYALEIQHIARAASARTVALANTADSALLAGADVGVLLPTPPELIAGSTRLGAGTAQKVALNMMSTLAGIRLGHVYDGHMVNLVADNAKLRVRAARIVCAITACGADQAEAALQRAGGAVKPAVLLVLGAGDIDTALRVLEDAGHNLRVAISELEPGIAPVKQSE
jgi:N-acetylmuramic acid 6-phosphate etherase